MKVVCVNKKRIRGYIVERQYTYPLSQLKFRLGVGCFAYNTFHVSGACLELVRRFEQILSMLVQEGQTHFGTSWLPDQNLGWIKGYLWHVNKNHCEQYEVKYQFLRILRHLWCYERLTQIDDIKRMNSLVLIQKTFTMYIYRSCDRGNGKQFMIQSNQDLV